MTVSGCLSSVGWNGVTYVTYVLYNVQYRPLLLTLYKEQRSVTDTFLSTFDRFSHVSCTLFDICRGGHALFSCCAFIICSFQKGPYSRIRAIAHFATVHVKYLRHLSRSFIFFFFFCMIFTMKRFSGHFSMLDDELQYAYFVTSKRTHGWIPVGLCEDIIQYIYSSRVVSPP